MTFLANECKFIYKMRTKIITHKEKRIVFGNFLSLSSLQSINYLLPLIVLPYLARVLGMEKFGLIAFAQSLIQYFIILTDYGFNLTATRKISLCQNEKSKVCSIFSSVMTVKLILAVASFIILAAILRFIPRFGNDWLLYILSFGAVIGNALFPTWLFQGKEKMKYISIINIISGLIYTASIFIFVREPSDYLLVPLLASLGFIISGVAGLVTALRRFRLEFKRQSYARIEEELRSGWNVFISIVAINAYTVTRTFAVGLLTNNVLTGYYSIAEKISNAIQSYPLDSFTQAIYPRLSSIFHKNKKRASRLMFKAQNSTNLGFLVAIPIAFLASNWIVRIICGSCYYEAVLALQLLLVAVFLVGINAFRIQFLLICGRTDIYSRIHIGAALIGFPLIFILIWLFSYLGAALAAILIEAGIFTYTYFTVKKLIHKFR